MRIWRSIDAVPADLGRTVVTIGNFDGVHLGHQHVIRRAREVADELGVRDVVAVTFDPHPIAVLRPEHAPPTLTTIESRVPLLEEAGADDVLVIPFSRDLADWSPERFIDEIIVEALHAKAVVVGANFRFGHRAAGDVATLREAGEERDFRTVGIALDGGPQVWSSTYVRNCLAAGDVEGAAEALGRPFTVRGEVVRGDERGRELGYPTANLAPDADGFIPADGVYAGWLVDGGVRYPAAISVGNNPTFEGVPRKQVEAYVLDRDLDLYDHVVGVEFASRIRGMEKFDGIEPLIAQMGRDVDRARALVG